jgi:hypothetical protein
MAKPMTVKVADGAQLLCTHEIVNCSWSVQGHLFTTTFKVLPLSCYDAILGMEWLETFSPMQIEWKNKWLSFNHEGQTVKLQGISNDHPSCSEVTVNQLQAMVKAESIWGIVQVYSMDSDPPASLEIPPPIQSLVDQYPELFFDPIGIPPSLSHTHTIPLVSGAQPFRLKPYRYTPFQKDEIEHQVTHFLKTNMIKESTSPFASPALLVKKKTGDWSLCVDYRRLNAYTVKNKFPLPVIEELFEELHGAKWFTTLDLKFGFHQIMVHEDDQYKTAFHTHHGHFEYKVMPYGLTGAPATF